MKAPNKLYISQLIYGTWQYQTPDPDDETQVEYIRKDALMEWLKERYNSTISNIGCYTGNSVWKEVIEKLESL